MGWNRRLVLRAVWEPVRTVPYRQPDSRVTNCTVPYGEFRSYAAGFEPPFKRCFRGITCASRYPSFFADTPRTTPRHGDAKGKMQFHVCWRHRANFALLLHRLFSPSESRPRAPALPRVVYIPKARITMGLGLDSRRMLPLIQEARPRSDWDSPRIAGYETCCGAPHRQFRFSVPETSCSASYSEFRFCRELSVRRHTAC